MNIIITGNGDVGKSSLCDVLFKSLSVKGFKCGGIITLRDKEKNLFVHDLKTGKKIQLASVNNTFNGPSVGRYFFNNAGIDFGNKAIKRGIKEPILFVDEIGYLELDKKGFYKIIEFLNKGIIQNSLMVVRSRLLDQFKKKLKVKTTIFEVTKNNHKLVINRIERILIKEFSTMGVFT